jgi:oligopeptide transport system ATP-binding protein
MLLSVQNLKTIFKTQEGIVPAVDGVSFDIDRGQTLGIVGESGCGKSVTALSLMRLVPSPPGKISGGEIFLEGENLLEFSKSQMRKVRGKKIAMIFQDPMTSLNPVFTVGNQIKEMFTIHQPMLSRSAVHAKMIELLELVGIPDSAQRLEEYPHQFSGGMRQRVMIAMALSCNPDVLIADEPTTALDVTIQAQILDLIKNIQTKFGMAVILISHDFGVVAEMADQIAVMYAGKIIEQGSREALFENTQHPYTYGLLKSIPTIKAGKSKRLFAIPGSIPELTQLPPGCRFAPRCDFKIDACIQNIPELMEGAPHHLTRCIRPRKWEE